MLSKQQLDGLREQFSAARGKVTSFPMKRPFDREQFVRDLRELAERAIPFQHQVCNAKVGADCINLPRLAYEKQQPLPPELLEEFRAYYEIPDGEHLLATMRRWFLEIEPAEAQPGDLYVLYWKRNPCHVVTLLDRKEPPTVAEAYKSLDGSINRSLVQPLDVRRRIAAAFRIPDFA